MNPKFAEILELLRQGGIEFVLIGGGAAIAHGSSRSTVDIDVVYRRTKENIGRLVDLLKPHDPYLRGAPPGLPFIWDARTVQQGLNFTLITDLGDLDILGEVAGGGDYDAILPHTVEAKAFGVSCRCLDLDMLIKTKRAAGRPKDFESIAILEALREENGKGTQ